MSDYPQTNDTLPSLLASSNEVDRLDRNSGSLGLAMTIAHAADSRQGGNIMILNVGEVSYLADYFIVVTGFSRVQVRAISQAIESEVEQVWQRSPLRVEGQAEGTWILQDYGDVIAHVLMPEEREFYNLEAFWGHAEQIDVPISNCERLVT